MSYRIAHRVFSVAAGLGLLTTAAVAAGQGLRPPGDAVWPTWQARVNLTFDQPADGSMRSLRQAALLGDYYVRRHGADASAAWRGGFRATSGLVVGQLGLSAEGGAWSTSLLSVQGNGAPPEREVWPYVGFGYSGLATRGGWGFSADLGIALRQPAAAPEVGRALLGLRGWDGALRSIEPMPMLQLGVRYRF